MRVSAWLALASYLFCTPVIAQTPPMSVASEIYSTPQQLVAVDVARRLNIYCIGNGTPTVILDAGAGGGAFDWRHVQSQIGEITRVCAYDRAGHGWSDPATGTSDVKNAADDLHHLLFSAGIETPIVYVGHSIAGLYGVYFAAKYPDDVAGAVFVDPSFAHQTTLLLAGSSHRVRTFWAKNMSNDRHQMRVCLELAHKGKLNAPKTKTAKDCVDTSGYPDKLDDTLKQELVRQSQSADINDAVVSEMSNVLRTDGSIDDIEMDAIKPNFGDKLLIILTAGNPMPTPKGFTSKDMAPIHWAWFLGHEKLAKLSTRGSNIIVPNSNHYIQYDQPEAVIEAVRRVIMDIRDH